MNKREWTKVNPRLRKLLEKVRVEETVDPKEILKRIDVLATRWNIAMHCNLDIYDEKKGETCWHAVKVISAFLGDLYDLRSWMTGKIPMDDIGPRARVKPLAKKGERGGLRPKRVSSP